MRVRRKPSKLTPWFDAECGDCRRRTRALECRYSRTRKQADRLAWRKQFEDQRVLCMKIRVISTGMARSKTAREAVRGATSKGRGREGRGEEGRKREGREGTAPPPKTKSWLCSVLYPSLQNLFTHTLCLRFRCRVAAASNIKVAAAAATEVIANVTT